MAKSPHSSYLHPTKGKDYQELPSNLPSEEPVLSLSKIPRDLPCLYLGKVVLRVGCGTCRKLDSRICTYEEFDGKIVQQGVDCETCGAYERDEP